MSDTLNLARECGAIVHDSTDRTMLIADGVGCVFFDSPEKVTAFVNRTRLAALEEAAQVVAELDCAHRCAVGHEIAAAIRALKGAKP